MPRPALVAVFLSAAVGCAGAPSSDGENSSAVPADPAGLSFRPTEMTYSLADCDPEAEGCTYVLFRYPKIDLGAIDEPAVARLQEFVDDTMRAAVLGDGSRVTLEVVAEELLGEYRAFAAEFPDSASIPWVHERQLKVLWSSASLVTFVLDEYSYTGGAHPNTATTYWVRSLTTGEPVRLSDLFVAGYEADLTRRGAAAFRALHGVGPDASLQDAGFWFDDGFALNDNWGLDGEDLLFVYNPYEVAAYALGESEIRLRRSDLGALLRPGGPWTP